MNTILAEIISLTQGVGTQPVATAVPGLLVVKGDIPHHQLATLYRPVIGFTVQGTKIFSVDGQQTVLAGPAYYVLPVHVPATARVCPDAYGNPYISMGFHIDATALQQLLRDIPESLLPRHPVPLSACELDDDMLAVWLRLLRLGHSPQDVPALAPAYERELLYRVLIGPHGGTLRQLASAGNNFSKISQTIQTLRKNYQHPVEIGEIADAAGMAINTFHRHFKRITGLSPIQYQKQLRLMEARNLIAFGGIRLWMQLMKWVTRARHSLTANMAGFLVHLLPKIPNNCGGLSVPGKGAQLICSLFWLCLCPPQRVWGYCTLAAVVVP